MPKAASSNPLARFAAPPAKVREPRYFSISISPAMKARLKELAKEATKLQNAAGTPGIVSLNELIGIALQDFLDRCEPVPRAKRKR